MWLVSYKKFLGTFSFLKRQKEKVTINSRTNVQITKNNQVSKK